MNRYIIPICDIQAGSVSNFTYSAHSYQEVQEKVIKELCDNYNMLDDLLEWSDFVKDADKHDILIGDITDIETL